MGKEKGTRAVTPPFIKNRLWIHRKKMGYSQQDVATLLGHHTTSHVSDYERGERLPSLETALKLEIILCTPVAFLYSGFYSRLKPEIAQAKERLQSNRHT